MEARTLAEVRILGALELRMPGRWEVSRHADSTRRWVKVRPRKRDRASGRARRCPQSPVLKRAKSWRRRKPQTSRASSRGCSQPPHAYTLQPQSQDKRSTVPHKSFPLPFTHVLPPRWAKTLRAVRAKGRRLAGSHWWQEGVRLRQHPWDTSQDTRHPEAARPGRGSATG